MSGATDADLPRLEETFQQMAKNSIAIIFTWIQGPTSIGKFPDVVHKVRHETGDAVQYQQTITLIYLDLCGKRRDRLPETLDFASPCHILLTLIAVLLCQTSVLEP